MGEKNRGPNGYFEFWEDIIGKAVSDNELNYFLPEHSDLLAAERKIKAEKKQEKKEKTLKQKEEKRMQRKERSGLMRFWPF